MIERPFSIDLPDGATLDGEVRSPEGDPPSSAVVVVHGFKGFKDWGFFPYLCECLTRDGHAVVSFNFSLNGIGEDPTAFTDLEAFGRNTLSREVEEILRILHEVRDGGITPCPRPAWGSSATRAEGEARSWLRATTGWWTRSSHGLRSPPSTASLLR